VPLSEHEQRLLDQIERALYQDDPKFASTVRSSDLRTHMKRRLRRAAVILVIGFVLLLAGVVTNWVVGIAGFVVMLAALLLALSSWKRLGSTTPSLRAVSPDGTTGRARRAGKAAKPRGPKSGGSGGSLLGRLEERWNKRWDERGRD
jgi:uncharacterized membrane protein YgcG